MSDVNSTYDGEGTPDLHTVQMGRFAAACALMVRVMERRYAKACWLLAVRTDLLPALANRRPHQYTVLRPAHELLAARYRTEAMHQDRLPAIVMRDPAAQLAAEWLQWLQGESERLALHPCMVRATLGAVAYAGEERGERALAELLGCLRYRYPSH